MKTHIQVIKVTNPNDFNKCHTIRKKVFVEEQNVPLELEIENDEFSEHFLTLVNDVSLATGRIRIKDSFIKFERIATLKESRGLGVGKALMEFMTSYALNEHPKHLPMMHAQLSAVDFYKKLGWLEINDVFYEASIPHKTMIYLPKSDINDLIIWSKDILSSEESEALMFLKKRFQPTL